MCLLFIGATNEIKCARNAICIFQLLTGAKFKHRLNKIIASLYVCWVNLGQRLSYWVQAFSSIIIDINLQVRELVCTR